MRVWPQGGNHGADEERDKGNINDNDLLMSVLWCDDDA